MQESPIGDKGGKGQDVDTCSDSADLPADSKTAAQSKGNRVSHSASQLRGQIISCARNVIRLCPGNLVRLRAHNPTQRGSVCWPSSLELAANGDGERAKNDNAAKEVPQL